MRLSTLLLLAAPALAQFGPASTENGAAAGPGPSPTNSIGCHLHGNEWHCAAERTATPTAATPTIPSPTESANCKWHGNHWDCEGHEEGDGECIIHVGHVHGNCSPEQLACGRILMEDYNMPLHIGAIFIILVTSAIGIMIPMLAGWTKRGGKKTSTLDAGSFGRDVGIFGNILFVARHFGTGIIFSTAFVHLLFHGFVMFNNECLGEMVYEATAAAIALASALITFFFDFLGSRSSHQRMERRASEASTPNGSLSESPRADQEKALPHPDDNANNAQMSHSCVSHTEEIFREEQGWQVILLEAGIIFHSIMIGVTLGAGSGVGWTTLLIVLVFHQFFEGAALGARIALLYWISKVRAVLMACAFVIITPIGVAIGIGVRKSFSQNGKAALLSVGILNSISAGILAYTAFRLLIADFIDGPVRRARWGTVTAAFLSMLVGLVSMSVLGKWA